jgi:predicted RNA-binding Zn-ribbon protein involved in translation (DUF1610 family)
MHYRNAMNDQLSVTAWPGSAVPVPRLERYPDAELDGEFIYLGERWELAQPPPEFYLRQARKTQPTEVLDFVRTVGGVPTAGARDLYHDPSDEGLHLFSAIRGRTYAVARDWVPDRGYRIHIYEIAYRMRVLDVLGRHAVAYRNGNYLAPIWTKANPRRRECRSEAEAWQQFQRYANAALATFHVGIQVQAGVWDVGAETHTLLAVGALQIYNDLVDEVEYLTCPNCGQIFARQVGGSMHYSRRTGVTYCSPSCATAARVKAYRARKRAEMNNDGQHPHTP